jgi:hypothetical protein
MKAGPEMYQPSHNKTSSLMALLFMAPAYQTGYREGKLVCILA